MKRLTALLSLLSAAAFGQTSGSTPDKFEAADVHPSPRSDNNFNLFMRGPQTRAGRYEIRTATMVDLIATAYGVEQEKVFGGPNWLELDRYDITAKLPTGTSRDAQKTMLRALLAERFHLVARTDTRPMPAYLLTAGKKVLLKDVDPESKEQKGCHGKPRPQGTPLTRSHRSRLPRSLGRGNRPQSP